MSVLALQMMPHGEALRCVEIMLLFHNLGHFFQGLVLIPVKCRNLFLV